MLHTRAMWHNLLLRGGVIAAVVTAASAGPLLAGPPPPLLKEHAITIDATNLVPPTWWQVPGVTPSIWASDPDSLDAPKSSERRELALKPGKYKFISFTFDFPFVVNLEGKLEFATSLDQCIEGRGTQTLVVRCSRVYPHGGERDAYYEHTPSR